MTTRGIEIIGGGLAGLSLGRALCRAQVPVTVYEALNYPRPRVCGEFICGLRSEIVEDLRLAPALDGALQHHSIAWCHGDAVIRRDRLPTPAWGLSRHTLDLRLARLFERDGGELRTRHRFTGDAEAAGRVWATGRIPGDSGWLGLKTHIHGCKTAADLEFHLGDQAYVGVSAVEGNRHNLCGLFARRPGVTGRGADLLANYLRAAGLHALADRAEANRVPDTFAAVAAVDFRTRAPGHRFAIGDSFAMIPPFTGDGMAMAFESASIAAPLLTAYAAGAAGWDETVAVVNNRLRRRFRRRLLVARTLQAILIRPAGQAWLSRFSRSGMLPFRLFFQWLH